MPVNLRPVVGNGGLGEGDLEQGVRGRLSRVEDCQAGRLVETLTGVQAGKHLGNGPALNLVQSG